MINISFLINHKPNGRKAFFMCVINFQRINRNYFCIILLNIQWFLQNVLLMMRPWFCVPYSIECEERRALAIIIIRRNIIVNANHSAFITMTQNCGDASNLMRINVEISPVHCLIHNTSPRVIVSNSVHFYLLTLPLHQII